MLQRCLCKLTEYQKPRRLPRLSLLTKSASWQTMRNSVRLCDFVIVGIRVYGRGQNRTKTGKDGLFCPSLRLFCLWFSERNGQDRSLLWQIFIDNVKFWFITCFKFFHCRSDKFVISLNRPLTQGRFFQFSCVIKLCCLYSVGVTPTAALNALQKW